MWTEGNFRRNLMDMHIDDSNPEFLTKIDVDQYVAALKDAGIQAAMVKGKPHTGLCYYPTKIARMHKGLHGFDFFGTMVEKCHENGIAVIGYYSQIFDNWAYEHHPDWRLVAPDGKNFREYRGMSDFRTGRYGICCPNNPDYRQYVKDSLTELVGNYKFEGIFLDMLFFPDICYCPSCRKRYMEETGKELPRRMDWQDPDWLQFVHQREKWITDFAKFSYDVVKSVRPEVTVEHQFSMIMSSWVSGTTEEAQDYADAASGDYYGGFLQQSFINKYYRSVSKTLPFVYHTSRCDPELVYHTTTKTKEELELSIITALSHNGAFLLVDAINPDGSIVPSVYHDMMKPIYAETQQYEKYVGGQQDVNAAIWFSSHAKYDPHETGIDVKDHLFHPDIYQNAPVAAASVLRAGNVPFDVIPARAIPKTRANTLILSHVAEILDDEEDKIEDFIRKGGNVYISGPIGNPRLAKLLGVEVTGESAQDFTYLSPTAEGKDLFKGFDRLTPFTIPLQQTEVQITDPENCTVLATETLPYTMTNTYEFAAIHSNPPGVYTDKPAAILKTIGKSRIIWVSASIEMSRPYMSKLVFERMIRFLTGRTSFDSNAPKWVEVMSWEKAGETYFSVINEQEEPPVVPLSDIYIDTYKPCSGAVLLPAETPLKAEKQENGATRIYLPKLDVFHMLKLV